MAKLPPDIRIHVAPNTSQDVWEIKAPLDLLQHEIEAREMSQRVKTVQPLESKQPPTIPPSTSGAYLADSQNQQVAPTCFYCSGKHFSASCETVTKQNAAEPSLPFMCLQKGRQQD